MTYSHAGLLAERLLKSEPGSVPNSAFDVDIEKGASYDYLLPTLVSDPSKFRAYLGIFEISDATAFAPAGEIFSIASPELPVLPHAFAVVTEGRAPERLPYGNFPLLLRRQQVALLKSEAELLIASRAQYLVEGQAAALLRQIAVLFADEEEFCESGMFPSMASLAAFLDFLIAARPSRLPSVAINSEGEYIASWSPSKFAKLSITFRAGAGQRWVAVDVDNKRTEKGELVGGGFEPLPTPFDQWLRS